LGRDLIGEKEVVKNKKKKDGRPGSKKSTIEEAGVIV